MSICFDVAVIGGGFAGTVLSRVLNRRGHKVLLLDAGKHPRFAVGESSTPIADMLLRRIGETEGMEDLCDLSAYGSWMETHRDLPCGLKRGFSYFDHQRGVSGRESRYGDRSLVVAASPSDAKGDTHWYRPAVDEYFFRLAADEGVDARELSPLFSMARVGEHEHELTLESGETFRSRGVIDCSGNAAVTTRLLGGQVWTDRLRTQTCASFGHFRGVDGFANYFNRLHGDCRACVPFQADDTAQHHLVDGGWVWMLRFNHGVTSLGLTLDLNQNESTIPIGGEQAFLDHLRRSPDLREILDQAHLVGPRTGLATRGRLQQWIDPVVSERVLLAPTTSLTLDPLHSTGIAHALAGVLRLADIVDRGFDTASVGEYRSTLISESACLDQLVRMAYDVRQQFTRFTAACMVYFVAAIHCEEAIVRGEVPDALWLSRDADFARARKECAVVLNTETDDQRCVDRIKKLIAPWNHVGLFSPDLPNRYAYTATK